MPYKVILADDEPLVLVGLQSMMDWKEQDCEICALARNGHQLQEAISDKRPDIVITDIKMPIVSGLEVLMQSSKANPNQLPVFILLTNFEDFSMAKQAIRGGAIEYLVKLELTKETLSASIGKAKATVDSLRQRNPEYREGVACQEHLQDNFFVRLYNGLIPNEETFRLQSQRLGISLGRANYRLCYAELIGLHKLSMGREEFYKLYNATTNMIEETLSLYGTFYLTSLDIKHVAILFVQDPDVRSAEPIEILRATNGVIQRYFSVELYCGLSLPTENPFLLGSAFQQAKQAQSLSGKDCPIVQARQVAGKIDMHRYLAQFSQAFPNMDLEGIGDTFDEIANLISTRELPLVMVIDMLTNVLYLCISFLTDGESVIERIFPGPESYRSIYRAKNTAECTTWLKTLRDGILSHLQESMQDYRSVTIGNVQRYIKENVDKKLKLSEISSAFGFSPNYLSTLFSKYAGMNLVEYINKTKIQKAKERLLSEDLKLYSLAEELGFESPFYFSKVFKRITGLSPSEFRRLHRNNATTIEEETP